MALKSKRSKACAVSPEVRKRVLERDGHKCVRCGRSFCLQIAHYIPRSLGGLGIEQNLVTLCLECHTKEHNELHNEIDEMMRLWLENLYPNFTDNERRFKKW